MKTMIKKGCKQLKLLKKVKITAHLFVWFGLLITVVGYVGFVLTILKLTGPELMIRSFLIGLPIMILSSLACELAIYQEIRLRFKFRKYMQMIKTIQQRHQDEVSDVTCQPQTERKQEPVKTHSSSRHSLVCSGI